MAIDPNARFERLKTRAKQEQTAQSQQQKEALNRRFASLGQQNSGASIKIGQQVEKAGQKQLGQRIEGIEGVQEESQLRTQEIKEQRDFQTGEAGKQRDFATGQAKLQREFAAGQNKAGREFATSERLAGEKFSSADTTKRLAQQAKQFNASQKAALDQFNETIKLQQAAFDEELRVNNFNMGTANQNMKDADKGLIEGVVGDVFGKGALKGTQTGQIVRGGKNLRNKFGRKK